LENSIDAGKVEESQVNKIKRS